MRLNDIILDPPVFLAPLAGITDLPFRELVARFGAGLVVSEMIASQDLINAKPGVREKAELGFGVAGTSVQIAGCEAYWMAEAAKMAEANGARIIDINMGCPAKKVTSTSGAGASGSALMREPDLAISLIEAVVEAVNVPVTLKTRLGWDDDMLNAPELVARAEAVGIQMVTIHGRTRCQFYKGAADWGAISKVKEAVDIPVIANGDIVDTVTAKEALRQSGADGVMLGRGVQGRPWLPAVVASEIYGAAIPEIPSADEFIQMVSEHYDAMLSFYGTPLGVKVARKHLGWYMDEAGCDKPLRTAVLTAKTPAEVMRLLPDALGAGPERSAA
ncbi:tRNA dihydrouridine synthase DusB [Cognatishimia activa]|uniref:tRNA-dihydrouridine synthase n=1 Tax=Cognatishimia activa TaxID=1715691 RepID=A0A975EST8_9RHOB|nr:tRNA dihydrouridine synthase DusB [Cognatishimia activa]QTN37574.1 tRNA dihydrouridine synthase DusB [Cognatishimia activa]